MSNHYPKNLAEARRMIDELRGSKPIAAMAAMRKDRKLTTETVATATQTAFGKASTLLTQAAKLDAGETILANLRTQLAEAPHGEARLTILSQGEKLLKAEIKRLQSNP